jgi:hypothetical protein
MEYFLSIFIRDLTKDKFQDIIHNIEKFSGNIIRKLPGRSFRLFPVCWTC